MSYRSESELYSSDSKQSDAKQKVTLYLSSDLHRQLKLQAAVESESMSTLAEKALSFYLAHTEVVERVQGTTHQVHHCPSCAHPFVLREGRPTALPQASMSVIADEQPETSFSEQDWIPPTEPQTDPQDQPKQDELVPC